ncbi:MAG: helix-turn-helix transcriptional regulator [Mariniphaga sp.]
MNDNSYNEWVSMSDMAICAAIGKFIKHHRLNQNKTQDDISEQAGISRSTLSLMERGEKVTLSSLIQILRVLDLLYIMDVFKVTNEISPIEYAKLQKSKRQRARNQDNAVSSKEEPTW